MKKRVFAWIMVFMMVLTGIPVFGEGEKPEVVPAVSSETEMVSETPTVSATGEPMLDTDGTALGALGRDSFVFDELPMK